MDEKILSAQRQKQNWQDGGRAGPGINETVVGRRGDSTFLDFYIYRRSTDCPPLLSSCSVGRMKPLSRSGVAPTSSPFMYTTTPVALESVAMGTAQANERHITSDKTITRSITLPWSRLSPPRRPPAPCSGCRAWT